LLPYHVTARDKYRRLGLPFALNVTPVPAAAQLAEAARPLRERGLDVRLGGRS